MGEKINKAHRRKVALEGLQRSVDNLRGAILDLRFTAARLPDQEKALRETLDGLQSIEDVMRRTLSDLAPLLE